MGSHEPLYIGARLAIWLAFVTPPTNIKYISYEICVLLCYGGVRKDREFRGHLIAALAFHVPKENYYLKSSDYKDDMRSVVAY
jgi:hypothetical protein